MWGVVAEGLLGDTVDAKVICSMLGDTPWTVDVTAVGELLEV